MAMNDVTIAGGGIAGLSTAIALHRYGAAERIQILEASSEADFKDVSAGAAAQLTPNGLRALQLLGGDGLLQRVLESSSAIEQNFMVLPSKETPFDTLHALPASPPSHLPTVMIRWGLLRQLLAEMLPEGCALFDQKVVSYSDRTLVLEHNTPTGTQTGTPSKSALQQGSSSLLIAADGKDSLFRPTPLVSNRRINIKAVIQQTAPLPHAASSTYSMFSPTGLACFLGPAGPGWTYWAVSIPVATQEEETAFFTQGKESLKEKLIATLATSNLAPAERQVYMDLILKTAASKIVLQASSQAELPACLCSDSVVLVGDAAHAMNASYGQAISFAFEDAVTLAHCLATATACATTSTTLSAATATALAHYSELRRGRCVEMQQKSQERTAKSMRGESTDGITSWIHDWDLSLMATSAIAKEEQQSSAAEAATPMIVVA